MSGGSIIESAKTKLRVSLCCYQELSNWPRVFAQIGLSHLHFRWVVFKVRSRKGVELRVPNNRTSRWALLESLALDAYRIGNYPWPDPNGPRQVLDIGAHVGSFTCSLAAVLPGATFTCVEPSVQTSEWLSKNLERNNLSGRATVLSVAVSDVDGPIDYWYDDAVSGENSLEKGTRHHKILVDGLSISSIFALMTKPPDIVKLDCEGGEYASILGGSSELYKSTNHVFLEYHPIEGHSFQELLHRLEEFGLHLEWHETGHIRDQGMAYFTRRK